MLSCRKIKSDLFQILAQGIRRLVIELSRHLEQVTVALHSKDRNVAAESEGSRKVALA